MSRFLQTRLDVILNEMERDVFRHFSVSGDEGSGKMSFIELLSDSFHNQGEVDPSNKLIVVTIE
jgi:uridine kinase